MFDFAEMQQYQNLFIHLDENFENTLQKLTSNVGGFWIRDEQSEKRLQDSFGGPQYCFRIDSSEYQKANLWIIMDKNTGSMRITNIVPLETHHLSKSEYNQILQFFLSEVVTTSGLNSSITPEYVTLEDLIEKESAMNFYRFSAGANKSTGRGHPCDEDRWLIFIYSVIQNGKDINIDCATIRYFLMKDGWDEDMAWELGSDYEYGITLIRYALEQH